MEISHMAHFLSRFRSHAVCCGLAFVVLACASVGSRHLRGSAEQLHAASNRLYVEAQHPAEDAHGDRISRYAEGLSKAAESFDRAVRDGESRDNVEEQYRRVADRYTQLREGLTTESIEDQNERLLQNFDDVTTAYRRVQGAMNARFPSEKERMHY
jgi:hypothetical protein